jgi:Holliday junction resolvase RusA-like endonuclease
MTFYLTGQMPSGKNQVQLALVQGRVMKFPNKRFKAWRAEALAQLDPQCAQEGAYLPLQSTIRLRCEYTPGDARVRDVSGLLDALFHLLVKADILEDDGQVHEVEWKRLEINRESPGLTFHVEAL